VKGLARTWFRRARWTARWRRVYPAEGIVFSGVGKTAEEMVAR
jgi:hypothetical protein